MSDPDAIRRLLGPAGAELTCEECFAELDRYVELTVGGEDADGRVPGMHAHLQGCPACAEEFESLRDLVAQEQGPVDPRI
jgi:hypothetical protein